MKNDRDEITHFITVNEDITERRELELQLQQSQKMDSIGQLAGGIAHDFNNNLTAINGYADLAIMTTEKDNPVYLHIKSIKESGDRAANLVRQLLAFSRKQIIDVQYLDINKVILDLGKMLQRMIGEDVRIEYRLSQNILSIEADPAQIEQILMNLVVNARDAINMKTNVAAEKLIIIETKCRLLDEHYRKLRPEVLTGEYIQFSVSDTGIGMDEKTRQRIFEPFYTTKERGKGTGLGLATVYGIVKQNNAYIYVYSEPNQGSSFKVMWPVAESVLESEQIEEVGQLIRNGNETILIVEDDKDVLNYARMSLETMGYTILEANNGQMGLDVLEKHAKDIHLVLSDVVMPVMSGVEMGNRIIELYPHIKIIYASGYADENILQYTHITKCANFLSKPFTTIELSQLVRNILDQD